MVKQRSNRKKKQHFVPQFYLRGFADGADRLFALDKTTGRTWPTSVRDVGHENYFFNLSDEEAEEAGLDPQVIEDILAERDGRYSVALEQVLLSASQGEFPRLRDCIGIALFVGDTLVRTPSYRIYRKQSERQFMEYLLDEIIEMNRQNFRDMGIDDPVRPRLVFNSARAPAYHAEVLTDLDHRKELAEFLLGMIWIVREAQPGGRLYASDSPVVRRAHDPDVWGGGGAGFCSRGIELTIPLSRHFALQLFERSFHARLEPFHGRVLPYAPDELKQANEAQVIQSVRFVYSVADAWEVALETMAAAPECCDPERPRLVSVTKPARPGEHGELYGQIPL